MASRIRGEQVKTIGAAMELIMHGYPLFMAGRYYTAQEAQQKIVATLCRYVAKGLVWQVANMQRAHPGPIFRLVLDLVATETGVPMNLIIGYRRDQKIANARQIVCYVMREVTDESSTAIGGMIGRDHSTVLHAHGKVKRDMALRPEFGRIIERLCYLARTQPLEAAA